MKEKFSGYRVLGLSYLYMMAVSGMQSIISPVYTKLPEYLGVDFVKLSLGTSLMKISVLVIGLIAIRIIRKIGPKKCMYIGATLCFGMGASIAWIGNYAAFCVMEIFSGLITGLCLFSMTTGLIMNWFVEKRALFVGINTGFALVGSALYMFIGGFLCDAYGVDGCYLILGVVTAIIALICGIFTIDNPAAVGEKAYGTTSSGYNDMPEKTQEVLQAPEEKRRTDRALYRSPVFWLVMIATALNVNSVGSVQIYTTTYLPMYGMKFTQASSLVSIMSLVGGLLTFVSGYIVGRLKLRKYVILVFTGSCLANLLMLAYSGFPSMLVVVMLVVCFGLGYMSMPLENILVGVVFSDDEAQNVLTKMVALEHGTMTFTSPMWAKIMTTYGFSTLWILLALVNVMTITAYMLAFRFARKAGRDV